MGARVALDGAEWPIRSASINLPHSVTGARCDSRVWLHIGRPGSAYGVDGEL